MMTGLPGSNDESDIESARRIAALGPDGVRVYPTVIVRDTALCDLWRAGKYREHTVEDAVRVCARILPVFEAAGIPVIRLGLNPTEDLSGGDAVGGAYHPALGDWYAPDNARKGRGAAQWREPGLRCGDRGPRAAHEPACGPARLQQGIPHAQILSAQPQIRPRRA